MMQSLTNMDVQLLFWIQQNVRSDAATAFLEFFTDLGNMGALWIGLAVALFLYKKTRLTGSHAMLAVAVNVVLTNGLLKYLVARPRPFLLHSEINPLIALPTGFSFPSGHTSCSFAVAFVLYALLPKRYGIPALVTAVLVGFSRLYLGVHYPTDVLAGVLVGFVAAKFSIWFMKKMIARGWFSTSGIPNFLANRFKSRASA